MICIAWTDHRTGTAKAINWSSTENDARWLSATDYADRIRHLHPVVLVCKASTLDEARNLAIEATLSQIRSRFTHFQAQEAQPWPLHFSTSSST